MFLSDTHIQFHFTIFGEQRQKWSSIWIPNVQSIQFVSEHTKLRFSSCPVTFSLSIRDRLILFFRYFDVPVLIFHPSTALPHYIDLPAFFPILGAGHTPVQVLLFITSIPLPGFTCICDSIHSAFS